MNARAIKVEVSIKSEIKAECTIGREVIVHDSASKVNIYNG